MGFLNDIGRRTAETTNKIAKETKLKLKISDNKGKVSDLYEEIGKKIYEKHILEENIDIEKEVEEECKKIDELSRDIEEARMKILKLNQKKQCIKCNNEIHERDIYCSRCGEKQEIQETVFEEALEKIEDVEIKPENITKAKIVKEDLKEKIETQSENTDSEEEE